MKRVEEGKGRVKREDPYHGRDRNLTGPVSHQKSLRWMSLLDSVLLQTKPTGGGRGRGGGFLTTGDGQARAEGAVPLQSASAMAGPVA